MREKFLLVLAICMMTALPAGIAESTTWNLASDFVTATPPASGFGADAVWSYGNDTNPAAGPFSFREFDEWSYQVGNQWSYNDVTFNGGNRGGVSYVPTANGSGFVNPANCVVGFGEFTNPATRPIIFRWTAPLAMDVNLSGWGVKVRTVAGWCPTYAFGIRKNSEPDMWSETSTNDTDIRSFDILGVSVAPGDVIDFWAAPPTEYDFFACDLTVTSAGDITPPAPTINPPGGLYFSQQIVTITSQTAGATIKYTTDGTEPSTDNGMPYTVPFAVGSDLTIKAKAFLEGLAPSDTVTEIYQFSVAQAQVWRLAGDYTPGTPPASGFGAGDAWSYGNDTDPSGGLFSFRPFSEWSYQWYNYWSYTDVTLNAGYRGGISKATAESSSGGFYHPANCIVGFGEFTNPATRPIIFRWTAPISIDVNLAGWGKKVRDVTGWCPNYMFGIRKNSDPDLWSATSTSATDVHSFNLSASVERGDIVDFWAAPPADYDFFACDLTVTQIGDERTPAPTIAPSGGLYFSPQAVTLTSIPGATVHYTMDGSEPTQSSPSVVSGGTIVVSSSMTLKAKAWSDIPAPSNISQAAFFVATDKSISGVKKAPDGTNAGRGSVIVTAVFGDVFYVEETDRSSGIRCQKAVHGLTIGKKVDFIGTVRDDAATGECYVEVDVANAVGTGSISPLGLTGRAVGGSDYGLQAGIPGASGLNNIGLLVKVWGMITPISSTRFSINDGSGSITVEVLSRAPTESYYASVTGISSCEKIDGSMAGLIRARGAGDIVQAGLQIEPPGNLPWFDSSRRRCMIPPLTPSWVQNPMNKFNAETWATQLQEAGVEEVIVAVKQSYGEAYYPTSLGPYVGVDLIGPLTNALHARGMRILVYYNMQDDYLYVQHPEMRDQGNPGFRQILLDRMEEIVRNYPVDAIWFDLWGAPTDLMRDIQARTLPYKQDLAFAFNGGGIGGDELTGLISFLSTEGHDLRTCSRHSKALRRWGKPFELEIPENLGGWLSWRPRPGWSHTVLAALTAANGGTPTIGVTVSPDGTLDQGMLDELTKTWRWLERREPWFVGVKSWAEVGVIFSSEALSKWYHPPIGLDAALTDNHIPYDIIRPDADFSPYRLLVVTEEMTLSAAQAEKVRQFVGNGGKLLAFHSAYANIQDVLGITKSGIIASNYRACYMTPVDQSLWNGVSSTPVCVRDVDASYLVGLNGGTALAQLVYPFAPSTTPNIFYEYNAPADHPSGYPSIVHNAFGSGETLYVAPALTQEVKTIEDGGHHSAAFHKRLIANLVRRLGGADLINTDAPSQVEINLGRGEGKYIMHLTDCSAAMGDRFGPEFTDIPRLLMKVSLPVDRLGSARQVRLVPDGKEVTAVVRDGRLEFNAEVQLHSIYEIY